jgi:hypothetical protein
MLLNEEFHDLYISSHITRATKSRRMSGPNMHGKITTACV